MPKGDNIIIFGFDDCKTCRMLKHQLTKEGIPFNYVDISLNKNNLAFAESYGIKKYPSILINIGKPTSRLIHGGGQELKDYIWNLIK